MTQARVIADRLYGIEMRPQELALFGAQVHFNVRFSPIFEDSEAETTEHFQLLVLEVHADLPEENVQGRPAGRLDLLKCGWELELEAESPCLPTAVSGADLSIRLLLSRIAETVNDLAKRAGLEAPLGAELIDDLGQQAINAAIGS